MATSDDEEAEEVSRVSGARLSSAEGAAEGLSRWKMELRRRSPCSFRRSRRRRAQRYSAARMPSARAMVMSPGPGKTSIAMPKMSKVKPKRMVRKRLACWSVLIMTMRFAPSLELVRSASALATVETGPKPNSFQRCYVRLHSNRNSSCLKNSDARAVRLESRSTRISIRPIFSSVVSTCFRRSAWR